jgi:hypothetical protein
VVTVSASCELARDLRRTADTERAAGRLMNAQRLLAKAAASCTEESPETWAPRVEICTQRSSHDVGAADGGHFATITRWPV